MIDDFRPTRRKSANVGSNDKAPTQPDKAPEPSFEPPEKVEEHDELLLPAEAVSSEEEENSKGKPSAKKPKKGWYKQLSRKQWIIITVAGVLLIGLGVGAFLLLRKPAPKKVEAPKAAVKTEAPKPTNETSTLSGLQVAIGTNQFPVTGVMIENSPDARPQSGLIDAGVVFEAVAEGGITRFLALFQSDSVPGYLGPVRSVRPYYLDYLGGFDGAIAHVGGSPDGLAKIKNENIKDLDQFFNSGAYERVNSRYAPHNVYTSMSNLYNLQKEKGFSSKYTGFPRKAENKTATPTAKSVDLSISGPLYNVHYDYDPPTNSYLRNEGGKPHMDERTNRELSPKNVIAIVVPQGVASDGVHTTYQNIGNGKAYIFQDGSVTEGTWSKSERTSQITFTDANNKAIALNPGQTWISLVGAASSVSYKP